MLRSISITLLAAVACATVLMPAAAPAAALSGLGAVPSPFSPNGDGTYDRTAIRYDLSTYSDVEVTVVDSTMSEVIQLWADWADSGAHVHWWDGQADSRSVPDGDYTVVVRAHPVGEDWEESSVTVTVDTEPIDISGLSAVPNLFTPDGDGIADSTLLKVRTTDGSATGTATIDILDTDELPVRALYAGAAEESISVWWDGIDDASAACADGSYRVHVQTLDAAGNTAEAALILDLDRDPPTVGIDYPDTLDEFRVDATNAVIAGWAYDRSGISSVEISFDQDDWIDVAFSGDDTVRWEYSIDCTTCVPDTLDESHVVYYRAHDNVVTADGEGHYNGNGTPVPQFDLIFDVAGPMHVDSDVGDDDGIYYPGETITISTEWDDAGYDIDADFSEVDSYFDAGDVSVTGGSGGTYTVTYPISSQAVAPVSSADIEITATDAFDRSETDASVSVSLAVNTSGPSGLALDRNWFDPTEGEALEIDFGQYVGPVSVELYSLSGALVRSLERESASSVTWDGSNEDGDYVASGVYLVRIETDEGDAVRKVAVVK